MRSIFRNIDGSSSGVINFFAKIGKTKDSPSSRFQNMNPNKEIDLCLIHVDTCMSESERHHP